MSLAKPFNTRPLYQQVADEFVSRIVSGAWAPGQSIENETDIARSLGISLGTVRKAFEILSERKLLERHQGRGTVVADFQAPRMRSRFSNIRDLSGTRVSGEVEVRDAVLSLIDEETAARLHVTARTPVLRFRRLRSHAGRIFLTEEVYLRVDAGARDMTPDALHRAAVQRWTGQDLATHHSERVRAEPATESDRALFGLGEGTAVLRLERVIYSYQDRPLELRVARCHLGADLVYGCL